MLGRAVRTTQRQWFHEEEHHVRLLTVEGKQHGMVFVAGNACIDDYVINLNLPNEGAT